MAPGIEKGAPVSGWRAPPHDPGERGGERIRGQDVHRHSNRFPPHPALIVSPTASPAGRGGRMDHAPCPGPSDGGFPHHEIGIVSRPGVT